MNSPEWVPVGTTPSAPLSQSKKVGLVKRTPSLPDRREFIRGVTVASIGSAVALNTTARAASQPRSGGAIVHAQEGQRIPKTPDGRQVTVKIDSELIPGVRMSMVTDDLHQTRRSESIYINTKTRSS